MHFPTITTATVLMGCIPWVTSQAVIISAQGINSQGSLGGPVGMAIGVDPTTPRNCAATFPCQQDADLFSQRAISRWRGAGQTLQSGKLKINTAVPELIAKGQVAQGIAGGQIAMVLHQITGDGNGPFVCAIDQTATGEKGSWEKIDIFIQVPGQSPTINGVVTTPFPLVVNLPEDMECTGTFSGAPKAKKVCLIRCQNFAVNGPFGGVIPFEQVTTLRSNF